MRYFTDLFTEKTDAKMKRLGISIMTEDEFHMNVNKREDIKSSAFIVSTHYFATKARLRDNINDNKASYFIYFSNSIVIRLDSIDYEFFPDAEAIQKEFDRHAVKLFNEINTFIFKHKYFLYNLYKKMVLFTSSSVSNIIVRSHSPGVIIYIPYTLLSR